jgi:phthalate 4,5-cis-dihydrodiol dehydrogenase
VRLLAGSPVVAVNGSASEGAYSCTLRFQNGASAALAYSGYGHFRSDELMGGTGELGKPGAAHPHFGLFIVSCDKADLRPMPNGVMIYDNGAPRLDPVPPPQILRQEVVDELYAAVVESKPPLHSGEWGMQTVQVCLAILRSAREAKEIAL